MSGHKLARVKWYLGQTLLPEHFNAQQEAISAELRLRTELQGLPAYGIAKLSWNEAALAQGVIAVAELTALLPDGTLLDLPGNAAINRFSLKATGASRVAIYLHLLSVTLPSSESELYVDDPKVLQRVLYRLQLSAEETMDRAVGTIKLAEMEASEDVWHMVPSYIPPLLQVGQSPFLRTELQDLAATLEGFRPQLTNQLTDSFFRSDRIAVVRRCVTAVCHIQSLLKDLQHGVRRHPYFLFEALRTLYFEVCNFHEVVPEQPILSYVHDDLDKTFRQILTLLDRKLRVHLAQKTHFKFSKRNGLFTLAPLPSEAAEFYLLIRRAKLHERTTLDGVKLASPSRLALVHRLALKGIPYKPLPQPPFYHAFGADIDFYELTLGEEWEHALRESALAFYVTPALEQIEAFLYWRHG